jgi:hypothetical protein
VRHAADEAGADRASGEAIYADKVHEAVAAVERLLRA